MRTAVAAAALAVGLLVAGSTGAQALPWVPDIPTGPCPYAGCDDWDDFLNPDQIPQ